MECRFHIIDDSSLNDVNIDDLSIVTIREKKKLLNFLADTLRLTDKRLGRYENN